MCRGQESAFGMGRRSKLAVMMDVPALSRKEESALGMIQNKVTACLLQAWCKANCMTMFESISIEFE